MIKAIYKIAEQRIREAQERGDFDNLAGKGQPQDLDEYYRVPEEFRMAYSILKNAGCLPPELMVKKEILQIEDMLAQIKDEKEKYLQIKKLNFLVTKLNTMRNTRVDFEEQQRYYEKLVARMSVARKDESGKDKP